jgi:CubicO group peptidase (beta-lactamase class C family)
MGDWKQATPFAHRGVAARIRCPIHVSTAFPLVNVVTVRIAGATRLPVHPCAPVLMPRRFHRLLPLVVLLAGCSSSGAIVGPIAVDAPLPTATPAEVGLDGARLDAVVARLGEVDHDLHSMLVARDGRLAVEAYFNGYGRDNPHDIRSATKSITSLLAGIAIDRGALEGEDTPLMTLLRTRYPDVRDRDDILVRHLLTMSAGLDCDDGDRRTRGQEDWMYRSRDWVAYFLSLDRTHAPGDTARYCTGGVVALGEAIAQATGEDLAAFAERELFGPLGIENYRWARFDGGRKVDAGGHLLLTPQAMVKLGMLVLQGGRWNGRQVVPAEWIERSTREHVRVDENAYGFLWWRYAVPYGEEVVEVVAARGNGGQLIFIVPEYDLVSVFTGGYYNSERVRAVFELFFGAVLPSVEELRPHLSDRPQGGP